MLVIWTENHIKTVRSANESGYNLIIDNSEFLQVFNVQLSLSENPSKVWEPKAEHTVNCLCFLSDPNRCYYFQIYVELQQIKKLIQFRDETVNDYAIKIWYS